MQQISKKPDICALCGKEIPRGTVFILRRQMDRNGGHMVPIHVLCSVMDSERRMAKAAKN